MSVPQYTHTLSDPTDTHSATTQQRDHYLLGTAQVHDIGSRMTGVVGKEIVFGRARHVDNVFVLPRFGINVARLSQHDAGVHVDGIGWILHRTHHTRTKHLLQTHNVALGAVCVSQKIKKEMHSLRWFLT